MVEGQKSSTAMEGKVPSPGRPQAPWLRGLIKMLGEQPEARWGTQLIRIAQDMILVCDEELRIYFHNQAFVRRLGYKEGSYVGRNLVDFVPQADRGEARKAMQQLAAGHVRGLRVEAKFLTRTTPMAITAEVTRSRRGDGSYFYYMIARPDAGSSSSGRATTRLAKSAPMPTRPPAATTAMEWMGKLPIAAWQSDRNHHIVALAGRLWSELDGDRKAAIGSDLSKASATGIPPILAGVKPSLRSAARQSEAEFDFEGTKYRIVVEPMRGSSGEFSGSVGFIALAASVSRPGKDSAPVVGTRTTTVLVNQQNATRKVAERACAAMEDTSRFASLKRSVTTITEPAVVGATDSAAGLMKTSRVNLKPQPLSPPTPRPGQEGVRESTSPVSAASSDDELALPG